MRIFLRLCLLTLLTYALADTKGSGCNPEKGAQLLHRKNVYRRAIQGLAQDVYVAFPEDSKPVAAQIKIVDFCIYDHDPKLFGAKPVFAYSEEEDISRSLSKATIILRGQESRGINSTVEFYGFSN